MNEVNYIFRQSPSGDQIIVTRNGNTETFYSNDYVQDMIDKHMQRHGNSFSVLKHQYEEKINALQNVLDKVDNVYAVDRDQFAAGFLTWYLINILKSTMKQDTQESMIRLALSSFKQSLLPEKSGK